MGDMCTTLPDLSYNYSSPLGLHPQRYYHDPPSIQLNRKRNPSAKNTFGTFFTLGTVMCLGVLFGWFWSVDVRSFYRCNGGWEMGIQKCFADVYYNMLQDPHWPVHFKVSGKKRKKGFFENRWLASCDTNHCFSIEDSPSKPYFLKLF